MDSILEIFAQYGDPESTDAIRPFHRELDTLFKKHLSRKYFRSIERLSIVLRVCGTFWKFEGDGPDRLRIIRKHREITVDLIIPENRWRGRIASEIHEYFADQIQRCFEALLKRARKEKEILDEASLIADFQRAIREFKANVIATGATNNELKKLVESARVAMRGTSGHHGMR